MALVGSRPSWQTAELSEEWPMSSPSSAASSGGARNDADASLRQHAGRAGSFRSIDDEGESSPGAAPGTFVVRDDVPDAALNGPLAKLQAAGGLVGGGADSPGSRSLFSPLRLESMFQPPSPPQGQQQQQQAGSSSEARSLLPEVILTPPPATVSTTPTRPPSGPSPSPSLSASPSAPSPSPMPRPAQQLPPILHRQLYHVPQVPSRLQKTYTPADLTASTIDPVAENEDAAGNDGETGAVTLERSEMGLTGSRINLARSSLQERNWPGIFEFECRPAVSPPPSNGGGQSAVHDSFGSFGPMPAAHSTPADRSRASSRNDNFGSTPPEPSPTTMTRLSLHTSHARDHGAARTAPSSAISSIPEAPTVTGGVNAGARKLNLFRPTYDTFTRDFMSAIVDTIEGSPSSTSSGSTTDDSANALAAGPSVGARIFSDRDVAVDFRDAKRIRLAYAGAASGRSGGVDRAVSDATNSSSFERLRRSKASLSSSAATASAGIAPGPAARGGHGPRASRDWDGEARELMQRVKELGRSSASSGRPAAAVPPVPAAAAAVIGARVLSGGSGEGRGWGQGLALSSTDGSEDGRDEIEVEGRRIEPIAEVPETEAASPQGTEIRNYRLPSRTRAAAALAAAPAASRRAIQSMTGRETGPRRQTDLPPAAASNVASALPARSRLTASARDHAGDEKENASPSGEGSGQPRQKRQSPRKLLRRLIAADEVEKELDDEGQQSITKSSLRQSQPTGPPPAPSSGAADAGQTSDLHRYVSSSTGPPPSTFGISTVSSYTKHVGPPVGRSAGVASAKLNNIPFQPSSEPLRVGKLEFDRERSKWVKVRPAGHARGGSFGSSGLASEEDDPFQEFNSTTTSGRAAAGGNLIEQLRASSTTPPAAYEEVGSSRPFTRDASRSLSLPRSFERSLSISSNVGGDGFDMDEVAASLKSFQFPTSSPSELLALSPPPKVQPPPLQHHNSAPLPAVASTPLPATQQRTRVASTGGLRPCLTPVSVLKKRSPGVGFRESAAETPGSTIHRRSVSFSDGKKAGKIDLQVDRIEFSLAAGGGRRGKADGDPADRSSQPSARAVRIQSMLDGLGDDEVTESMASLAEQTPSKGGSSLRHYKPRDPPRAAAVTTQAAEYDDETEDSTFAGNITVRSVAAGRSFHYGDRRGNPGDATFLTECSFEGVRDRLVEIITDVHPYVAYWEELRELDLEGRLAGSVARLKEFLPKLVEVNLNRNDLSYLSGLPASVERLHAAHNRLSELTAVAHLSNLRFLNIGFNQLEAVNQLECLKGLTELIVDSNSVTDISPLFSLTKLVSLSAKGNGIVSLDVTKAQWPQLQSLDLSGNKLTNVIGLEQLDSLSSLTLDKNRLRHFQPAAPLTGLQTLKLNCNQLRRLDIRDFPQLRTLYADGNELETINPTSGPTRLQTLSARSQAGTSLVISGRELKHVKRLFLSGNALSPSLFAQPCPDLAYLELASCKLTSLPPTGLAAFAPALKSLNLNYNYLADLSALANLRRLRKLSVVGSRLEASASVVWVLQTLPALEMLDLRMNPFTLAMYLPLIVQGLNSAASPAELGSTASTALSAGPGSSAPPSQDTGPATTGGAPWAELDGAFRRALPDEWYVRRLAHRGLVMRACPRTTTIDGVGVEPGERRKADELLATLEARRRAA